MNAEPSRNRPTHRIPDRPAIALIAIALIFLTAIARQGHPQIRSDGRYVTTRDQLFVAANVPRALTVREIDHLEALGFDADRHCLRTLYTCEEVMNQAASAHQWTARPGDTESCLARLLATARTATFVGYERRLVKPPSTEGHYQATRARLVTTASGEDLSRCPDLTL